MLKNIEQLRKNITHILDSGANEVRLIDMIELYIKKNYDTDWRVGDIITNGLIPKVIESVDICALLKVNDSLSEYESIDVLKGAGYSKVETPEITPETIALKFDVDVRTVKLLLDKIK